MPGELIPHKEDGGSAHANTVPDRALDLYDQASELLHRGKTEDALSRFKEAVDIAPDFTNALHEVGNCLADLGRHEEASEYYNRALQEIGDCLYTIARHEEAMGRYWRAVSWYEEAGRYYQPDLTPSRDQDTKKPETKNRQ